MDLFVYYTVRDEAVEPVLARVRAMQAALAGDGRHPRLMRREPSAGETQTWMEIYPDATIDFEARLAAFVTEHHLATLAGPRHVERFADLASGSSPSCA